MKPGQYDFLCPQGTTFDEELTWKSAGVPVDLTGYTSRLQIRDSYRAPEFVADLYDGHGITLGGSAGTIRLSISDQVTREIGAGTYVYDLELYGGSTTYRLIEGKFVVTPEVTR